MTRLYSKASCGPTFHRTHENAGRLPFYSKMSLRSTKVMSLVNDFVSMPRYLYAPPHPSELVDEVSSVLMTCHGNTCLVFKSFLVYSFYDEPPVLFTLCSPFVRWAPAEVGRRFVLLGSAISSVIRGVPGNGQISSVLATVHL